MESLSFTSTFKKFTQSHCNPNYGCMDGHLFLTNTVEPRHLSVALKIHFHF